MGEVTENRKLITRDSMESAEIAENTVTRLLIVGTSSSTSLGAKAKGTGKSKSNVTEISESDTSKQV